MKLSIVPLTFDEARAFIRSFHRHSKPPLSHRFSIGVSDGTELQGVAVVGRPVARMLQDGVTAEVLRCCVRPAAPKGSCSALYAASWRAWRAMGGMRLITYTLQSESGASLRGAGWTVIAERQPRDPSQWQSRPGREWQPVVGQAKLLWGVVG